MRIIYIAGPYRNESIWGTLQNIRRAEMAALQYWRKGFAVICPHKNSALMDGAQNTSEDTWLNGDLEILSRCDVVVALPGWKNSAGASQEVEHARSLGIPVWDYPV